MKITQLLEGKPFMTEFGIVGYSTAVLETGSPICDEPIHFTVRYADGRDVIL